MLRTAGVQQQLYDPMYVHPSTVSPQRRTPNDSLTLPQYNESRSSKNLIGDVDDDKDNDEIVKMLLNQITNLKGLLENDKLVTVHGSRQVSPEDSVSEYCYDSFSSLWMTCAGSAFIELSDAENGTRSSIAHLKASLNHKMSGSQSRVTSACEDMLLLRVIDENITMMQDYLSKKKVGIQEENEQLSRRWTEHEARIAKLEHLLKN
jgi:hypothetical protein